jgi:ribosomal protein L35AE/L33A
VGQDIRVWWNDDHGGRFYEGAVLEYDTEKGVFKVRYDEEEASEVSPPL